MPHRSFTFCHYRFAGRWCKPVVHGVILAALLLMPQIAQAAVTVSVTDGVLTVTSDADDALAFACNYGNVEVNGAAPSEGAADCATVTAITVEGGPGPNVIDASGVLTDDFTSLTSITLHGGGGNDLITGTQTVDTLIGDAGNDHLAGGKGNDQMNGGPGADELIWRNGDGSDTMEGEAGADIVHVIGAAERADAFVVAPNGDRVAFTRTNLVPFTLDIGTTETVLVYRGELTDTVQISRLPATQVVVDGVELPVADSEAEPTPMVIVGAGALTNTIEAYRLLLGGENNGGEPGSRTEGRREINWDGVPDEQSVPNGYDPDFFNAPTAPRARGAVLSTPGESLMISADSDNPDNALPRFGNLNPTYADIFQTFSAERLFSPVGSNIADLTFFVPGSDTPAVSRGFGAVYTDIDTEHTAFEYFDIDGNSLGKYGAPVANEGLSFLGVIFPEPIVHRVRITYGTGALGPDDGDGVDVAVMDDFIYGEPQPVPATADAAHEGGEIEANLVGITAGVALSLDDPNAADRKAPGEIHYAGEIPAAIRADVRTLVVAALDTPDNMPYDPGLNEQSALAWEHAQLAQNAALAGDLAGTRMHAEHVWNILHGEQSELFGDINEDGQVQNPGDGYGVWPYAFKVADVATQIAATPDLDEHRLEAASGVVQCAQNISDRWGPAADESILAILDAGDADAAKAPVQALVTSLDTLSNGVDADGDGILAASAGECGAAQAYQLSHHLFDIHLEHVE